MFLFVINLVMVMLNHEDRPFSGASSIQWNYCSADVSKYSLDNVSFVLHPDRLVAGQTFTVNGSALLKRTIPQATLRVAMRFNSLQVLDRQVPLCNSSILIPSECPLKEGPISFFFKESLPSDVPAGKLFYPFKCSR